LVRDPLHKSNPFGKETTSYITLNIPATTNMKTNDGHQVEFNILTKCRK